MENLANCFVVTLFVTSVFYNGCMTRDKITSFTDLMTWQKAHKLVLDIYSCTLSFPKEERYSLTDQVRRAAVSVTSNIAEGFGRNSKKEKRYFYFIARGSTYEIHNQLIISKDIGYLKNSDFKKVLKTIISVKKLLNASIKSLNTNY